MMQYSRNGTLALLSSDNAGSIEIKLVDLSARQRIPNEDVVLVTTDAFPAGIIPLTNGTMVRAVGMIDNRSIAVISLTDRRSGISTLVSIDVRNGNAITAVPNFKGCAFWCNDEVVVSCTYNGKVSVQSASEFGVLNGTRVMRRVGVTLRGGDHELTNVDSVMIDGLDKRTRRTRIAVGQSLGEYQHHGTGTRCAFVYDADMSKYFSNVGVVSVKDAMSMRRWFAGVPCAQVSCMALHDASSGACMTSYNGDVAVVNEFAAGCVFGVSVHEPGFRRIDGHIKYGLPSFGPKPRVISTGLNNSFLAVRRDSAWLCTAGWDSVSTRQLISGASEIAVGNDHVMATSARERRATLWSLSSGSATDIDYDVIGTEHGWKLVGIM